MLCKPSSLWSCVGQHQLTRAEANGQWPFWNEQTWVSHQSPASAMVSAAPLGWLGSWLSPQHLLRTRIFLGCRTGGAGPWLGNGCKGLMPTGPVYSGLHGPPNSPTSEWPTTFYQKPQATSEHNPHRLLLPPDDRHRISWRNTQTLCHSLEAHSLLSITGQRKSIGHIQTRAGAR